MGAVEPPRGVQVGDRRLTVARVLTDVGAVDKEFDYIVPEGLTVGVGEEVRVDLAGRRVGGWVTALHDDTSAVSARTALKPLARRRGLGPEPGIVDLAAWAAYRWAGPRATFLTAASAGRAVTRLPHPARRAPAPPVRLPAPPAGSGETVVLRLPPAANLTPLVAAAAQAGPTLVIVPGLARTEILAARLSRAGADVALLPKDWPLARAGAGVVVGSRSAAWAPCPGLAAVVVIDGHEESLTQEGAPTWSAVDVAIERARRAGAGCTITTPCPPPELLHKARLVTVDRGAEYEGWAAVEVLDRREDDPRLGLYSDRLVQVVRSGARVACILNRTGRIRLLSCGACGELSRCENCGAAVTCPEPGLLQCGRCATTRPAVCTRCDSTRLKSLRVGTSRAREDLERLALRPVAEVTARSGDVSAAEVVVGTEAVLHRGTAFDAIAFVDFDQELLAPRLRAADEALALLAVASRLVRGRRGRVLVQTRLPDHPVLTAARRADPSCAQDGQEDLRRALRLPPFAAVALMHGPGAQSYAIDLRTRGLEVLGPDAGRWLVKAPDRQTLCEVLATTPRPGDAVRVAVDPARL